MEANLGDPAEEVSQQTATQDDLISEECSETRFSLESQDIDSNQGRLSSGSAELIQENFQEMGIDNNWQEEPFPCSSTAADYPLSPAFPALGDELNLPVATVSQAPQQLEQSNAELSEDRQLVVYCGTGPADKGGSTVVAGSCGLRNLGNTCFMNAGLQCLSATPALVAFFLHDWPLRLAELTQERARQSQEASGSTASLPAGEPDKSVTGVFARLLAQMWEGSSSTISPHFFKRSLGAAHAQFKDCHQHDCQEFLALLLDTLHEQLNAAGGIREAPPSPGKQTMAVAGCSYAGREPSPDMSPGRTSNIQQAEMMSNKQNQRSNKNCAEQARPPCPPTPTPCLPPPPVPAHLGGLELRDFLKDAKTSNVNMLAQPEPRPNNLIKFDSEKFGGSRLAGPVATTRGTIRNLVSGRTLGSDSVLVDHPNNLSECSGKDGSGAVPKRLKQTNLLGNGQGPEGASREEEEECTNSYKRLKLVSHIKNKDVVVEAEMTHAEEVDSQQLDADTHWQKHISSNKSIVADSFQGQFRSTVVCATCHHVSVTFEPFMYLSVPLPHALEQQMIVTYVPADSTQTVTRYLLCLNKYGTVRNLREAVLSLAGRDPATDLVLCDGRDSHMCRVLSPDFQLKTLNDPARQFYAMEVLPAPVLTDQDESGDVVPSNEELPKCNICLEEIELIHKPLRHGDACECVLCAVCLEECKAHHISSGQGLKCPVCSQAVDPDLDFIVIEPGDMRCKADSRVLLVPVVFRVDKEGEDNNQRSIRLYGEPRLLRLNNKVTGALLYELLTPYASQGLAFSVLLVAGHGLSCSRCMYNTHCPGCVIDANNTPFTLQTVDTLAVRVLAPSYARPGWEPMFTIVEHDSVRQRRKSDSLSLYDCLQAFTKSETLDEHNPWFCPRCNRNQCATKTMSVWRYPDIVIVYLKRFVFHDRTSTKLEDKVTFPLTGLALQTRRGGGKTCDHMYNLYSIVCHSGGVTSGHYYAYTKHPHSAEWSCYNDESVTRKRPQEEEYCTAYVLFYQRADTM